MLKTIILFTTIFLCATSSKAAIVNFNFTGHVVDGSINSPHREGGSGYFGESYLGSISYDTEGAELLSGLNGRYYYTLPIAAFNIAFSETKLRYFGTTDGENSSLHVIVWNDYESDFPLVHIPKQDRYEFSFVFNQTSIFRFLALDFALMDGEYDTSLIESAEIPNDISSLIGFESYHMHYTHYDGITYSYGTSGVGNTPFPAVPLPASFLLMGVPLFFGFCLKKGRKEGAQRKKRFI